MSRCENEKCDKKDGGIGPSMKLYSTNAKHGEGGACSDHGYELLNSRARLVLRQARASYSVVCCKDNLDRE